MVSLYYLLKDLFCSRDNICHIVKAPADVKWKIREHATEVAFNAVNSLEGAGVFAVELFLTRDGQVVNLFHQLWTCFISILTYFY